MTQQDKVIDLFKRINSIQDSEDLNNPKITNIFKQYQTLGDFADADFPENEIFDYIWEYIKVHNRSKDRFNKKTICKLSCIIARLRRAKKKGGLLI